jgi:hypothetical protein
VRPTRRIQFLVAQKLFISAMYTRATFFENPGHFVLWRKIPNQWRNLPGRGSHPLARRHSGLGHSFPEFGCAVLRGGCDAKKHIAALFAQSPRILSLRPAISPARCTTQTDKKEGPPVGQPGVGALPASI